MKGAEKFMGKPLKMTSIEKTLKDITEEISNNRLATLAEIKNETPATYNDLPDELTEKNKHDYMLKIRPNINTIYKMKSNGFAEPQIAEALGVSPAAFRKMKKVVPELKELLVLAEEDTIEMIESSMFHSAMGFEYEEEAVNGKTGDVVTLRKTALPNFNAQKYVLGNLRSSKYADQRQIVQKIDLGADVMQNLMNLPNDVLRKIIQESAVDAQFVEKETDVDDEN